MYNQGHYHATIAESGSRRDRAFQASLRDGLDFNTVPWTAFAAAVEHAVDIRHDLLSRLIDRGEYLAGG
jgi:hypothetical protein